MHLYTQNSTGQLILYALENWTIYAQTNNWRRPNQQASFELVLVYYDIWLIKYLCDVPNTLALFIALINANLIQ